MPSLGFWNLIIIGLVALLLRNFWKLDDEKAIFKASTFLKHPLIQKLSRFCRKPLVNFLLQALVVLIVTRLLIFTGWTVYTLIRPNPPFWDFKVFYMASQLAHHHLSPFNVENFNFVYPPNILPLLWPLSYFSINTAFTIWTVIHLFTIGFILWGANLLLDSKSRAFRTVCTIMCALIYGLVFDMRAGNISSFLAALLIWTVVLAKNGRNATAGVLLGIAAIKPTLSILFIPYFLLKKRFSLVFWCIATTLVLASIGLTISGSSVTDFLEDFTQGLSLFFQNRSNNPYLSPSRIDLMVIGSRFFPDSPRVAKMISDLIVGVLIGGICAYLYKKQASSSWSSNIYLSEVALISCLSISINYSQETTSVMLIPAVVFLLNYLLFEIKHRQFSWMRMSLWLSGVFCLLTHTGLVYHWLLEPLGAAWKKGSLPYILKITICSVPNYALLVLTVNILSLAALDLRKKHSSAMETSATRTQGN